LKANYFKPLIAIKGLITNKLHRLQIHTDIDKPAQVSPSPEYPGLQAQMKLPGTLVQFPFTLHGLLRHSSISGKELGWKTRC